MLKSIQACSVVILIFYFSLFLSSCGGGGDTIIAGSLESNVVSLYATNGANWNDYVKDDGSDSFSATDTACDPATDSSCLHGGQMMSMEVPGKSSCDGLTADDRLFALEWTCDNSVNPVRFVSTGFKPDQAFSDLIDFNASAFKENYLLVWEAGSIVAASLPSTWWSNPIVTNNDGSDGIDMNAGEIHLITQNANATYIIGADRVALLIKPGVTLTGSAATNERVISATGHNYIWLEGMIDATGDTHALYLATVDFSALHNLNVLNAAIGIYLSSSTNNSLSNITASGNGSYGVYFYSSTNNSLSDITATGNLRGVSLYSSSNNNSLSNITATGNGIIGVTLDSSMNNSLSNITASGNYHGVSLYSSANNSLSNISVTGNIQGVSTYSSTNNSLDTITASGNNNGVSLITSTNNSLNNITASENSQGVSLADSSNNSLSTITASGNTVRGVYLDSSSNNSLNNITASGNSHGVYLDSSSDNSLSTITASGNTYNGVYLFSASNNSLSNVTASGNLSVGIFLNSASSNTFTDELQVGNNTSSDCIVSGGTNPGLIDGTCVNQGSSDAILTTGVSVTVSFVDAANGDYSLLANDTIIRDVLAAPTGDGTYIHTWSDTSTTEMLRNAVEIQDDGLGNDNLLCETNETCLFTPNIAAYQGHGNLVPAGTFSDGTITGVTLMRYETNGY